MTELRWILLGLGVLFCLGLWWWETRRRRQAADDDAHVEFASPARSPGAVKGGRRLEPTIGVAPAGETDDPDGGHEFFHEPGSQRAGADGQAWEADTHAEPGGDNGDDTGRVQGGAQNDESRIVSIRLFSAPDAPFGGRALLDALRMQGLQHGKFSIFHKYDARGARLFSVASLLEPGSFDLARMEQMTFKGVILFAVRKDAGEPGLAEMQRTAQALAGQLRGTLTPER